MAPRAAYGEYVEEDMSDGDDPAPGENARPALNADGTPDWAAWNKTQQRGIERFRKSKPSGVTNVLARTTQPLATLCGWFLDIHSDAHAAEQRSSYVSGFGFTTVGMEIAKGSGFDMFFKEVEKAFWDQTWWMSLALKFRTRYHRSLASGALARILCGVKMLICADADHLPQILDKLLLDIEAATEIHGIGPCRWNRFVEQFFQSYDTVAKLQSEGCQAVVWTKSWLHQRSAMRLESRMASLRALVHQRQQTWRKSFLDINSEWMMLQNRVNQKASEADFGIKTRKVKSKQKKTCKKSAVGKFKGCQTGGGGKRRAGLSDRLKAEWASYRQTHGRKKPTKDERSKVFARAHAAVDADGRYNPERWTEMGKAGTASHRAGGASFGGPRPTPPRLRPRKRLGRTRPAIPPAQASGALLVAEVRDELQLVARSRDKADATAKRKRNIEQLAADAESLQKWSQEQNTALSSTDMNSIVPELDKAACWPVGTAGNL